MSLPGWLEQLLPGESGAAWQRVAPFLPAGVYLGGGTGLAVRLRHRRSRDLDFFFHRPVDLDRLREQLEATGPFADTERAAGTLNGLLGATRIRFLQAGLERPERQLAPASEVAGIEVAAIDDLLAMKLNAIAGRGQLRDYLDLMAIEQQAGRTVDEGLALFLARYQPDQPDDALRPIVLALGHLDDVADDPFLPVPRDEIARYWQRRQPQVVAALDRFGGPPPPRPR